MHKYETIMYYSEDDGAFVVDVPELPGCMADGETPVEAMRNAQNAMSAWIETAQELGRAIPEPKGRLYFA